MLKRHFHVTIMIVTIATFEQSAMAMDPTRCSTLAARCVGDSSFNRNACFQKFGRRASLCSTLPVGKIVAKRVKYTPQLRGVDKRVRLAKLVTRVERMCLDNFDIQFRNAIDFGPIDSERQAALLAQLRRCKVRLPPNALTSDANSDSSSINR